MTESGGLPAGTVSFLFTDIEGSTRLMRDVGEEAYAEVLDLHHKVLRACWERHGGHEVNTEGDAFFVAFASAPDALSATVDAQRMLASTDWPHGGPVDVRMAIHTGYALPRAGDYAAMAVNQAARVVGAAHGRQILLTEATMRDAAGMTDVVLEDLGPFAIRDFDAPPRLFRVKADGWEERPTAPRARPAAGHNLVRPTTSLLGRDEEQSWLEDAVGIGVVTTIVGPGGVGKTRLAVEAGLSQVDRWPGGVWFVDLSAAHTEDQVASAIAESVGAPLLPGRPITGDLTEHLKSKQALLILDNCEQVQAGAASTAGTLLASCADIGILATSRRTLGLRGERALRLAPLDVRGGQSTAVQLFLDRAGNVRDEDLASVHELCRLVSGLPLAIELVAARTAVLPPPAAVEWLRDHEMPVALDDPTLPERHRSLTAVLDWSYELLDAEAKAVFRRLGMFETNFDLALATVAVGASDAPTQRVASILWDLVDQSLVIIDPVDGNHRFRLMAAVRTYAGNRCEPDERRETLVRLADFYVERLGPQRAADSAWLSAMGHELGNVRGVIRGLAGHADRRAQTLACAVGEYHKITGALATGADELRDALATLTTASPERVALLARFASLLLAMGDVDGAAAALDEGDALGRAHEPPAWDAANLDKQRGHIAIRQEAYGEAEAIGQAMLAKAPTARARAGAWNVIDIARSLAGSEGAVEAATRELQAAEESGEQFLIATAHGNLAENLLQAGRVREAAHAQARSLETARVADAKVAIISSLLLTSQLIEDRAELAVELLAAARAAEESVGFAAYGADRDAQDALLAGLRSTLGELDYSRAVTRGAALTLEHAAELTAHVLAEIADGHAEARRQTSR
ncbi:MAG: adenylate/guanylate cyclase domain-containing protein [Nitriliruptorales bacterium]|nr:adenylate/guanylate cyclase domain-containing protein [Nitriliruptorales bacterium]